MASNKDESRQIALGTALTVNGAVVAGLVGVGFSMVGYTPPEFVYARWSFIAAAALVGLGGATWLTLTEMTLPWRVFWGLTLGLAVFVLFPALMRWVGERQQIWVASQAAPEPTPAQQPASTAEPAPAPRVLTDASAARRPQAPVRSLSPEQRETLRRHLYNANFYKHASAFDLFQSPVAGDSATYAREFQSLLQSLGISLAVNTRAPSGPDQTGLMLSVRDTRKPPEGAAILKAALEAAGLEARYIPPVATQSVAGRSLDFALYVGPAPETQGASSR